MEVAVDCYQEIAVLEGGLGLGGGGRGWGEGRGRGGLERGWLVGGLF